MVDVGTLVEFEKLIKTFYYPFDDNYFVLLFHCKT